MKRFIVLIGVVIGVAGIGFGQAGQGSPDRGSKLGHAYAVGEFDTVNTTNGNLMFNFPLAGLPAGRGGATAGINLTYNSKLYNSRVQKFRDMRYSCNPELNGPENCRYYYKTLIEPSDKGGWQLGHSYTLEVEDRLASYGGNMPSCRGSGGGLNSLWPEMTYIHKLWIVFPDGSRHEMHPQGYTDYSGLLDKYYRVRFDGVLEDCGGSQTRTGQAMTYYSDDGSNLRMNFSYDGDLNGNNNTWTLHFPDGSRVTSGLYGSGAAHRVYDRNGNYVEGLTDQFGRSVSHANDTNGDLLVTNKGFNGANLVWRIKWKSVFVRKTYQSCVDDFTCPPEELRSNLDVQWPVVDTITEPNEMGGRTYTFSYNAHPIPNTPPGLSHGWGEVSGVDLPTGADISYAYAMDGQDGSTDFNLTKDILKNHPTTKTVIHDGETDTWTYSTGLTEGNSYGPDGSGAENYFTSTDENSWLAGLTYKTEFKESANGNSIRKVERIWAKNRNSAACDTFPARYSCNPHVKTEFTSIKSGGSYAWTAIEDFTYDKNGNVTDVREYDWIPYWMVNRTFDRPDGVPAGAASYLKRKTLTVFYYDTPEASTASYTDPDSYYLNSSNRILRLAKSVEVQDASTPKSRSEMVYDNNPSTPTTGNLTETKAWDSTKGPLHTPNGNGSKLYNGNFIRTSSAYNQYGMPTSTTDANNVVTTITYGLVGGHYDLYPTQTVTASGTSVARTSTASYDFYTGLVTTATAHGNTTQENVSTVTEYDPVGRPKKVRSAANTALESWTTTDYNDTARRIVVKSDLESLGDGKKVAIQHYDQLGRVRLSRTLENAATENPTNESHGIKVETKYKIHTGYTYQATSNPYRTTGDPTMGWTRTKVWNTGKREEGETFSGASLPEPWAGNTNSTGKIEEIEESNATTTTDEAGKPRRIVEDALGRQIRVDEADANGNLGTLDAPIQPMHFSYDALGNLTQITQGGQTRNFAYSSLSRLTHATNPENGTYGYTYDSNGNLKTKADPRPGVSTSFDYDALNRVTLRNHSDLTPDVTYTYDDVAVPFSKGKLTKISSGASETLFTAYDAGERVTSSQQKTDGETYTFGYSYNRDDKLLTQTYPLGKVIEFDYDPSGEVESVSRNTGFSYATSIAYAPHGQIEKLRFGNGKWETTQFNGARQITQIGLGNSASDTNLWRTNYEYGEWNGSTVDAVKNNGNVARQTTLVPTIGAVTGFTAVQTYTYDKLDRLKSARETIGGGQTWKQTFIYDRFGNKIYDMASGNTTTLGSCPTAVCNPSASLTNNKLTGYGYDAAGNITTDAEGRSFNYDAENRQTTATGSGLSMSYSYDGNGKRVKSINAVTSQTTIFVYDAEGKLSAEYTINVPAPPTPTISYLTEDALGSPRIVTNSFGEVKSRRDFFPFGEEIWAGYGSRNTNQKFSSTTDDNRQKFTGYQRDFETGLDFAQSRYYSPKHGRFTSPDEFKGGPDELFDFEDDASDNPTFYADLTNPQSFNKYQYTYSNPYKYTDENGHCPTCPRPAVGPLLIPAVAALAAILLGPDNAVAPTGRETSDENRSYRRTGGSDALVNLVPFPMIKFFPKAVRNVAARSSSAGKQTVKHVRKTSSKEIVAGSRPGKVFTNRGKNIVKTKNAVKNRGANKCDGCGVSTTKPVKTKAGAKRPKTETNVDHIRSRKKGGSGTPENGQILCFGCNLKKGSND